MGKRWVRRGFLLWAVVSTTWLANTMRTRGVDPAAIRTSSTVTVVDGNTTLEFLPGASDSEAALIFFCGSGVAAQAYAPMLRPITDAGFRVFVVKLPYRFAPMESHKDAALGRARDVIARHPEVSRWVISGHSLGGALAARFAQSDPAHAAALVLIGTTHPKESDLSALTIPVTKVYATNDGVAPPDRVLANKHLLPNQTKWVEIRGGNHSQFGHYGHQLMDGKATITREAQQAATRDALLAVLSLQPSRAGAPAPGPTATR